MRWRFNCVLMAAMASLGLCSPTDADLVALYTFDEGSGSTAQDSATNEGFQTAQQNQGTIGWTTEGVIGGALDLPGDASLQAADAIGEGATALTIAVWVNMDVTRGGTPESTPHDAPPGKVQTRRTGALT